MNKQNDSKHKDLQKIEEALSKAVYVSNDVQLKTEIRKGTSAIVSTDPLLYKRLLQKFPKEKVADTTKKTGKFFTVTGILITVLTGGVLAWIGLPIAGAGAAIGITGLTLDDYKNYTIIMDYEKNQVMFFKTKGSNSLKLSKKLNKVVR